MSAAPPHAAIEGTRISQQSHAFSATDLSMLLSLLGLMVMVVVVRVAVPVPGSVLMAVAMRARMVAVLGLVFGLQQPAHTNSVSDRADRHAAWHAHHWASGSGSTAGLRAERAADSVARCWQRTAGQQQVRPAQTLKQVQRPSSGLTEAVAELHNLKDEPPRHQLKLHHLDLPQTGPE